MECGQCGEVNREGARFCSGCGTALAHHCTNCQAELRATAKFCDECGTPVANAPAARAPAPTATRKIVTALFADLVGSTSFGERADAEVARTVMARYHSLLQDAIDAHGGTVAKFMGDGMMATFGIPEIAEDDALRAVRAGIDIQRRFTDFASHVETQYGETLGLRVGVNTGEVVIASGDADLVGDALNVAARIEHTCRPGNVTVGEETWRLTRGEFGYESLGEVTVAGRAQAVAIFEVIAGGAAEVETAAPFVGRAPEMASLRRAFTAATTSHAARLVTVLGSPGVGKTRLSRELCAAVTADENAITVELRCDRAGDATFAPIAQLIRDATDLGDDPDPASARERLGTLLADDEPERERLLDVFAGLVGVTPSRSVEETFWGVRRLVSASARDRPMVVVIDDIQWAEPLFLDLLEHLAEWVQDVPLLLLCLARPELRDVRPSLAERNRRVEDVIALDGLDSAATEALAAGLLGTDRLPAGLVERLPTSTDGNPLFVRELVRMLVDDKVIRRRGDQWELAIDAEAVEVPPTIQSLLAARVERLPDDERSLLELASVIGSEFNLGALRELAGARTPLPSLLESMRRKELVEPTGAYWGDEPVHRFHHVLIRDAAYRRLLKTTRADLHEKVAVWTDAAAAGLIGEHEAVIAFHYEQAYRYRTELGSVDDHVTGLGRRAAELLAAAADRALGQDDLAAAGALARRALALLPDSDGPARADLFVIACECTLASGDVSSARPVVEQFRAQAGDDPTLGAWASCFEAQLVGLTDPEGLVGAEATATGAAKIMEELGDGAGEAKAHQVRAELLARLGRVGDAELELDLALGAARRVDDRRRVTAVLGAAPSAALWGPSPVARAGGRCLDVVRLLRITTASPSVEATSMRCQAVLEALRGRFDVARSMLDSSRATLEELGLRHGLLETAYLTGVVELVAGDPAAAIGPLRDAYEGLIEMGVGIDAGRAAALLAHALIAEGRVDEAEPFAASSEQLAGQDLKTAIAWRVARAEVLAARGDVAGGIALAKEAVEIAAVTDLVIDHADACVALAALHQQAGDATNSRSVRAEARRLYDLKGATVPSERLADEARVTPAPIPTPQRSPVPSVPDDTGERHARAENAAAALFDRFVGAYADGRLDDADALLAPGYHDTDRRTTVSFGAQDRAGFMAATRAAYEMSFVLSHQPLAVRGDRLFLGRGAWRSAGDDEMPMLGVVELDAEGRWVSATWFDDDALAEAIDELDERYFAGEGAALASRHRVGFRSFTAANARDWDAYRDTYTPDFVCTDRRQIGWPTLDREGLVATIREYTELAPDLILLPRKVEIRGPATLFTLDASGTTPDGGAVEWVQLTVSVVEPTGVAVIEVFDEDDFAAALARLDELGAAEPAETRTPDAVNAAVVAVVEIGAQLGRWSEIADRFAPDVTIHDRRRLVGGGRAAGRDKILTADAAIGAVGLDTPIERSVIAIRGDRIALVEGGTATVDGLESVFLTLLELDEAGRVAAIDLADEADLVDVLDELDARYYAGEGAGGIPFSDFPVVNLVNRRDWSTLLGPDFPEFTQVDHRQLGWPSVDRQGWVATMQQYVGLVPDLVMVVRKLHTRGNAALTTLEGIGTTSDGSAVAWSAHTVISANPDGVIRMESFDLDDFAAALARLDELGAEQPADPRHPRADNTVTRAMTRLVELANVRDFERAGELIAEGFIRDDRRRVVSAPTATGRDEYLASVQAIFEAGYSDITLAPVAVRGDRLALCRGVFRTGDGDESEFLQLEEVDTTGRFVHMINFDPDDLVVAIDELDARYLAGEGAPHARILRIVGSMRDARRFADLVSPDFVAVDHQRIGHGEADRDYLRASVAALDEQFTSRLEVFRTVHISGNAVLGVRDDLKVTEDGGTYTWAGVFVAAIDATDRVARLEIFDLDDFPAALARLDELGAEAPPDPRHPRAENAATRTRTRALAMFNTGRFDEAGALLSDDLERVDRRSVVSMPTTRGLEDFSDASRASLDAGFTHQSSVSIAIRGDRLELSLVTMRSADGNELVFLSVDEIDESGRVCSTISFDEDALDDAVAELDARYVTGEGAPYAPMLDTAIRTLAALQAEDWTTLTNLLTDDYTFVDHRQIANPPLDRNGYVAMQQMFAEQIRRRMLVRTLHPVEHAFLCTFDVTGTDAGGGAFEWAFHLVSTVDGEDRIAASELFDEADFPAALARLDELGVQSTDAVEAHPARLENAATRAGEHILTLVNAGRIDEIQARLAPRMINDDRRTTVSWGSNSRDELLAGIRASLDVGLTAELHDVVAVRGDRLSLGRVVWHSEAGDEIPQLTLSEFDADGRCTGLLTFDDDSLLDAIAELDARYLAGEGAKHAEVVRPSMDHVAAINRRDWDALVATMRPDIVVGDHRGLWPRTSDRDAHVARMQSLTETSPDSAVISRRFVAAGNASLATYGARGTSEHGARYEYGFHVASAVVDGRFAGFEFFAEDDFLAALARFDELAGAAPTATGPARVENATTRAVDRFFALAISRRFDDAAQLLTPDIVRVDHRTAVSDATTRGRDEYMTALRATFEVGFTGVTIDHLAVRGRRLSLMRTTFATEGGMHLPILSVCETNVAGLVAHISLHDDDALDDAVEELNDRFIAGEGAPHALILEAGRRVSAAMNSQGRHGLASLLSDNFVAVNHRQLSWPTLDRDGFVAAQQSYEDQISEQVLTRSVQLRERAALGTVESTGIDTDGGTVQWVFHLVTTFDGDQRVERMEFFDDTDYPTALARLDELGARSETPAMGNTVTRLNAAWVDARNAGRSAELEHLIAPGYTVVSHRFGGIVPASEGVEEMRALSSAGDEVGFTTQSMVPVAVRGDRLALTRLTATTADGLISERLEVTETDPQGRFARTEIFDVDALAAAVEQLDRWYAEGEGAAHAAVITVLADGYAAMNRRDLDAWATIHSPDHRSHDHSPIGFGELGTQRYAEYLRAGFEQMPDLVIVPATLEVDGRAALLSIPVRDTTEGPAFESDLVVVTRFDEDLRIVEDHFFAPEQWHQARAMFEMLSTSTTRTAPQIRNNVTDALDRYTARLAAGDVSLEGILADDSVLFDRRRGISAPTFRGRAAIEANISAILEMFDTVSMEHLAIRGDHVALIRVQWTHEGFTLPILAVYESDEDGLVVRGTTFDNEDLDLALALDELEARFIAGEGAGHEFAILRAGDVRRGASATDRAAAYQALHTPDCRVTDHRLLSWPTETVSDVVDQIRADRGISRPRTTIFATLEVLGDAVLITQDDSFVTPEGSEYLKRSLVVTHSVAGRADSLDYFDPEQHDAARARFEELGAETRTPHVDNAVVRLLARGTWLDKIGAATDPAETMADDLVIEDRRTGVSIGELHGVDAAIENIQAQDQLFGPTTFEPIAVRGKHLALFRTHAVSSSGFELVSLGIIETNEAGQQCAMTFFDEHALAAALDALDARYADISGSAPTEVEASLLEGVGLLNRRDWDGFAALLHPDFVAVDHSPLGFPTTDRDGFVNDQMRGMAELVPDFVVVLRKVLTAGRATLVVGTTFGTTAEGNEYRWDFIQVMQAAADGRGLRRDLYGAAQWGEALARFDELSGAAKSPSGPREPANRISQTFRELLDRAGGGVPAVATLIADDVIIQDRRAGVSAGTITGLEAFVANAGAHIEMFAHVRPSVLAVRGDRLALMKMEFETNGFVSTRLNLLEANGSGRLVALVVFDEDDLDAAFEELEMRHTATNASPPEIGRRMAESSAVRMEALANGDRDAVLATYAPDFVREDRRRGVNFGTSNREQTVDALLAGNDVGLGNRTFTAVEVIGDNFALGEFRMSHDDGFELVYLLAVEQDDDGRLRRAANLDLEDREEAIALLHEWAAERERPGGAPDPAAG